MTELTPLDLAHHAMESSPDNAVARLQFYERLADGEVFVLLDRDPEGGTVHPRIFDVADGRFVLAFDRLERLTRFAEGPVPYVALSGRALAQMLAGQGLGLGINLAVAPSEILIPEDAVTWLADTTRTAPDRIEAQIAALGAPRGLPESVIGALDIKLASAVGLADLAYLVGVEYREGGRGHLLGFVGAIDGAEPALAAAVSEALVFSGVEAGALDVGFFTADDSMSARLAAAGLRFDLPRAPVASPLQPTAPGRDPDRPPILRPRAPSE